MEGSTHSELRNKLIRVADQLLGPHAEALTKITLQHFSLAFLVETVSIYALSIDESELYLAL